jgi:hypothetical protein
MKKIIAAFFLFITTTIYAVCPFCTIAVGAGIGLAEYF